MNLFRIQTSLVATCGFHKETQRCVVRVSLN